MEITKIRFHFKVMLTKLFEFLSSVVLFAWIKAHIRLPHLIGNTGYRDGL